MPDRRRAASWFAVLALAAPWCAQVAAAADSLPTAFTNALRNAGIPASAVSVVVQKLPVLWQQTLNLCCWMSLLQG